MKKIATFLKARWDSTAGATIRALATGGFWIAQANEGTVPPYVTMHIIAGRSLGSMGTTTKYNEDVLVQFSIWVTEYNLAVGWNILDALKSLYDDYSGPFPDGGEVKMALRTSTGVPMKDPESGYQIMVEYRYIFDEST